MTEQTCPRDIIKLVFQFQEAASIPFCFGVNEARQKALTEFYGDDSWESRRPRFFGGADGVDNFLSHWGMTPQPDGSQRDCLGCCWQMGSTHHLVDWPLKEPALGDFRLPDLEPYFAEYLRPKWPQQLDESRDLFRFVGHTYGLFERAWSLRGFENFLIDLAINESFAEELLEHITEWFLQSVDLMAAAPVDAVSLTDDHAGQRGMLMGAERWRRLFKPRWKRIFERVHHYGFYIVLHMCGDTSEIVPDLIEIGLDCMESCQPECMDVFELKRQYGRDIRMWGGLGAQSVLPFGTPDAVREETRRLKRELGRNGGFILAPAKPFGEEVPIENIAAYFEEACLPRSEVKL